jgi:hypothetical protein
MTKLVDRSSHPIPAAPRGLVYWSTRKISDGLTNTVGLDSSYLARSFGKAEQGTQSFTVIDGSTTDTELSSPLDPAVAGTEGALSVQPSQVRRVPNPDSVNDPDMPATGSGVIGKFSSHSANGEDASYSTSLSGAVTQEAVSPTRTAVNAILSANPGMSYRTAATLHRADLARQAARQEAKRARNRARRTKRSGK